MASWGCWRARGWAFWKLGLTGVRRSLAVVAVRDFAELGSLPRGVRFSLFCVLAGLRVGWCWRCAISSGGAWCWVVVWDDVGVVP